MSGRLTGTYVLLKTMRQSIKLLLAATQTEAWLPPVVLPPDIFPRLNYVMSGGFVYHVLRTSEVQGTLVL